MRSPIIDRVFQLTLLGMVVSGFLSVVFGGNLPAILQLLVTLALTLRTLALSGTRLAWRFAQPLPDRWLAAGVVLSLLIFVVDFFWLSRDFADATIHLLFAAVFLKLLSIRTERDFLYLRILAFLEIMAGAMLSAHAAFSFFLLAFLICGLANFAAGEIRGAARQSAQVSRDALPFFAGRLLKLTSGVSFGVVFVTIFLFFVLPRTTRAALQAWIDPRYHFTGFSNSVTLGQIGEIRMKREPVMHVRLQGDYRPPVLRWRGAALSKFTGRLWTANFKGKRFTPGKEMTQVVTTINAAGGAAGSLLKCSCGPPGRKPSSCPASPSTSRSIRRIFTRTLRAACSVLIWADAWRATSCRRTWRSPGPQARPLASTGMN